MQNLFLTRVHLPSTKLKEYMELTTFSLTWSPKHDDHANNHNKTSKYNFELATCTTR